MSAALVTFEQLVRQLDCDHPDAELKLVMYGSHCGEFWCGVCAERCVPRKRCPCCRAVVQVGKTVREAVLLRELACACGWAAREVAA